MVHLLKKATFFREVRSWPMACCCCWSAPCTPLSSSCGSFPHACAGIFPGKMLEKCWEEDWIGKLKNLILTWYHRSFKLLSSVNSFGCLIDFRHLVSCGERLAIKNWTLEPEPLEIGENVGRCDIIAAWLADVATFIEMFVGLNERMIPMDIGESEWNRLSGWAVWPNRSHFGAGPLLVTGHCWWQSFPWRMWNCWWKQCTLGSWGFAQWKSKKLLMTLWYPQVVKSLPFGDRNLGTTSHEDTSREGSENVEKSWKVIWSYMAISKVHELFNSCVFEHGWSFLHARVTKLPNLQIS